MEFCEECGTLMRPTKEKENTILICPNCKKQKENNGNDTKICSKVKQNPLDSIPILDDNANTLPTMEMLCKECGNKKVFWWTRQTRSSDEPETRFYRCTKCNYTWREYS
jgi:transcription factor S